MALAHVCYSFLWARATRCSACTESTPARATLPVAGAGWLPLLLASLRRLLDRPRWRCSRSAEDLQGAFVGAILFLRHLSGRLPGRVLQRDVGALGDEGLDDLVV